MQVGTMSLYFDNDTLARVDGSPFLENNKNLLKESKKYHVDYPVDEGKGDKDIKGKDDKDSGGDSGGSDSH
jgi:outer membrane protein assembly factor BamE